MTMEDFYGVDAVARMNQPLPAGHVSFRTIPEYILREASASSIIDGVVMGAGPVGMRWHVGPLRFERFDGDIEPIPNSDGPLRLVIWQRTTLLETPKGWWPGDRNMLPRAGGIGTFSDEKYVTRWRPHAQRQMRKWVKKRDAGLREIVELDADSFLAAYALSDHTKSIKDMYKKVVRDKVKAHGGRVKFWGSRSVGGQIDAGLATVDVPEASTSLHLAAFIGGSGRDDGAGTGLIDRWFKYCFEEGVRFFDMGCFWAPKELEEYKGFSRFKAQFDVRLIAYPRPLIRIVGRWGAR